MKYFPDRKVLAGGLAGVGAWIVMMVLLHFNVPVPSDFQGEASGLIGLLIAYLVPPADQDIINKLNDRLVKAAQDDPKIPVTPPSKP